MTQKEQVLTSRGCFSMDRRCGGDEGWEKEGAQRSLSVEGGALRR